MTGEPRKGLIFSPLVLAIAVVQGFLFINAAYWWGPDWPTEGVVTYLFLETIFLGWLGQEFVPRTSIYRGLWYWVLGFTFTFGAVYGVFTYFLSYEWPSLEPGKGAPLFIYTVFFVAPVEELIFRGILPEVVSRHERWRVPVMLVGTQVLFAVFHLAAYGGWNLAPMGMAFALGLVWVYASRRWTLFATMGSHAAYNLCILGVISA